MASYTLKGINDDFDTCSQCGKTKLKKVMWLAELDPEGGEIADPAPYGTTCGARLLKLKVRSKAKVERKIYEMLIAQLDEETKEILTSFPVYAKSWLLPHDLRLRVCSNEMTLKEALEERTNRYPILKWLQVERSYANAENFAKYL